MRNRNLVKNEGNLPPGIPTKALQNMTFASKQVLRPNDGIANQAVIAAEFERQAPRIHQAWFVGASNREGITAEGTAQIVQGPKFTKVKALRGRVACGSYSGAAAA